MPFIQIKVVEGVFTAQQRREIVERVTEAMVEITGEADVRPAMFELAKRQGWTLYELYQEQANLEDLFRQLTAEPSAEAAA